METLKRDARIAGVLYLTMVITGPFVLMYVPGRLFVPGDASATAANILAHQTLFRSWITVSVISELGFIATALALYRLLAHVNKAQAVVMLLLVLLTAPAAFLGVANDVATLSILRGGQLLSAFTAAQRDALATLLIVFEQRSVVLWELFWGLWLLPLGTLVYRCGFIPRFIGLWLWVNGIAYVALSAVGIWLPDSWRRVSNYSMPVLLGEVALMLWLVIVGARPRADAQVVNATQRAYA